MMQKYGYALPLYRQESEWKRIGLAFPATSLTDHHRFQRMVGPVYGRDA